MKGKPATNDELIERVFEERPGVSWHFSSYAAPVQAEGTVGTAAFYFRSRWNEWTFGVGGFVSLEKVVEDTREGYYDALYRSSVGWHAGAHTMLPWWEYFAGVMLLTCYRRFEERVGTVSTGRGSKRARLLQAIDRLPTSFRFADLERLCPAVSRPTIMRTLDEHRRQGRLQCMGMGRDARWEKLQGNT
jgi:hypothetical protein